MRPNTYNARDDQNDKSFRNEPKRRRCRFGANLTSEEWTFVLCTRAFAKKKKNARDEKWTFSHVLFEVIDGKWQMSKLSDANKYRTPQALKEENEKWKLHNKYQLRWNHTDAVRHRTSVTAHTQMPTHSLTYNKSLPSKWLQVSNTNSE